MGCLVFSLCLIKLPRVFYIAFHPVKEKTGFVYHAYGRTTVRVW